MNPIARKNEWLVWGGLALVIATLMLVFLVAQLTLRMVQDKPLPVLGEVADFTLTNQTGRGVSVAELRGKVWVADIIFTRCQGPCLIMSRQMAELQRALPATSATKLVSLTTDPEFDTPTVLKAYGERAGADPGRWIFLTGTKKEIANLAIHSLKLTAMENPPQERESPADLFIHTSLFVIVDKRAQLRGVFETTGEGVDPQQAKAKILAAVRRLERER